jgi:hypothetical protein
MFVSCKSVSASPAAFCRGMGERARTLVAVVESTRAAITATIRADAHVCDETPLLELTARACEQCIGCGA